MSRKPSASTPNGWDVANKAGLTEVYKPVIHEESMKACPVRSGACPERSRRGDAATEAEGSRARPRATESTPSSGRSHA